jgi:hypothetical protein
MVSASVQKRSSRMLTCRNGLSDLYPHDSSLNGGDLQRGSPRILFSLDVDLVRQSAANQAKRFDLSLTEDNPNSGPFGTPDTDIISLNQRPVHLMMSRQAVGQCYPQVHGGIRLHVRMPPQK